uniref:NADH-ubiquinone oxidoreductase chain 2 n=1 Tax=Metaurus sp. 1 YLZ-2024a TaxID=3230283 RepID=A0AAU8G7W5_9HEMI
MKLNSSNILFTTMMMTTTIMTMSSNNIMFLWMTMEMNMIVFMPIITKSKSMKDYSMKYLIIQSTSSALMLMSVLINLIIECPINDSIMLMTSMLMKLGMMPFHLWMPSLMQSSSWITCMLMMTTQKIIPIVISLQLSCMKMMILPMMLSMILAPISMLKQTSTKKIMAYSSISNTPMMLISAMSSKSHLMMFTLSYSIITISMMMTMKKINLNFINQMNQMNKINKLMMIINVLSMSGMPPMLGFFPKWLIIQTSMNMSMMITISIIISSIISTFKYMSMITPMMTSNSTKIQSIKTAMNEELMTATNLIGIPLMTILKLS